MSPTLLDSRDSIASRHVRGKRVLKILGNSAKVRPRRSSNVAPVRRATAGLISTILNDLTSLGFSSCNTTIPNGRPPKISGYGGSVVSRCCVRTDFVAWTPGPEVRCVVIACPYVETTLLRWAIGQRPGTVGVILLIRPDVLLLTHTPHRAKKNRWGLSFCRTLVDAPGT